MKGPVSVGSDHALYLTTSRPGVAIRRLYFASGELTTVRADANNAIDEYTDIHDDYAAVPHTLIVSPGLALVTGSRAGPRSASSGRTSRRVPTHHAELRPDHARGPSAWHAAAPVG